MRLEPTNIQQIGNELAIQWNDGIESYLDLQFLRRACPCAACGGEPDVLGNIMSRPGGMSYSENSFSMLSVVTQFSRTGATFTAPASTAFNISGGYHIR